jgi:hypothetical protein
MNDELWARHTAEIQRAFEEQARRDGAAALGFKEFCACYAGGSRSTAAMREHRRRLIGRWALPAALAAVVVLGAALALASRRREADR